MNPTVFKLMAGVCLIVALAGWVAYAVVGFDSTTPLPADFSFAAIVA
jgi:hypothetical protein